MATGSTDPVNIGGRRQASRYVGELSGWDGTGHLVNSLLHQADALLATPPGSPPGPGSDGAPQGERREQPQPGNDQQGPVSTSPADQPPAGQDSNQRSDAQGPPATSTVASGGDQPEGGAGAQTPTPPGHQGG
jgi:hypothetical protein